MFTVIFIFDLEEIKGKFAGRKAQKKGRRFFKNRQIISKF